MARQAPRRGVDPAGAVNGRDSDREEAPPRARSGVIGSARLGSARLGSARLGSARLGSARLGSARLGSARLGSARLGSARLGSARLGSARLGSARLGSARLGSARLLIILFAAASFTSAFKNIALPLHDCRRGYRGAGPEPCKRGPAASAEAAEPLGRDEGTKNARAGVPRSGSGHSTPNGRWLESYGAEPIAERRGTSPATRRSGHVRDRLARGECVEGAIRRARAQHPARVGSSHFRRIRPITSNLFDNTRPSALRENTLDLNFIICPMNSYYSSIGLTETKRPLPWGRGPIRPGRENAARCRKVAGEGSSRPTPGREAGPRCMRRSRTGSRARAWALLARGRACRDDFASSSAQRTAGDEGEMARREVAQDATAGDGKQRLRPPHSSGDSACGATPHPAPEEPREPAPRLKCSRVRARIPVLQNLRRTRRPVRFPARA